MKISLLTFFEFFFKNDDIRYNNGDSYDGRGISKEAPGMTALARWMEIGAGGGWLVWMELRAVGDEGSGRTGFVWRTVHL